MINICKPIRLGFIGAGFIGQTAHIDNYRQIPQCELTAIADLRPKLLQQVAQKYQFKYRYEHHTELLNNAEIDAVIVVTSRDQTPIIVADALLAGKPVFSEKPMAENQATANHLIDLAREQRVIYCVGYMKRFDQGVVQAKALYEQLKETQQMGALLQIRGYSFMGDSYCNSSTHIDTGEGRPFGINPPDTTPSWLAPEDKPLFLRYLNVHSHTINLLRYITSAVLSVDYFNYRSPLAQVAVFHVSDQAHDLLAILETGDIQQKQWQEGLVFYFEQGKLTLELPPALLKNVPAKVTLEQNGAITELTHYQVDWSWSFKKQAEGFIESLCTQHASEPYDSRVGRMSRIDATEALKDLQLVEALWQKTQR